jgi:AcrR family transcriptional regulator
MSASTAVIAESLAQEGLRARKKRRTRTEISDVATRLFAERGFDEVTLADIAAAAEVSVKTIFNHFGSKEELYFDRAGELQDVFVATVTERPAGVTVLEALRRLLVDNVMPFPGAGWRALGDPQEFERLRSYLAVEEGAPALRARRMVIGEELGGALAAAVGAEAGRRADDDAVRALAHFLIGVLHRRDHVVRAGVLERRSARSVRAQVTRAMNEAFDRLERAFPDLNGMR